MLMTKSWLPSRRFVTIVRLDGETVLRLRDIGQKDVRSQGFTGTLAFNVDFARFLAKSAAKVDQRVSLARKPYEIAHFGVHRRIRSDSHYGHFSATGGDVQVDVLHVER